MIAVYERLLVKKRTFETIKDRLTQEKNTFIVKCDELRNQLDTVNKERPKSIIISTNNTLKLKRPPSFDGSKDIL